MKSRFDIPRLASVKGFTLIELVMVIVIIGVLAAVALPRFFDMGSSARTAAANGIYGAVNSASAIAHSAALVQGLGNTAPGPTNYVTLEGNTQVLLAYGYPTAAGIIAAVNTGNAPGVASGNTTTWAISGGGASCGVTYTQPTASGAVPTIAGPSGC